jgi:hypothetical protein
MSEYGLDIIQIVAWTYPQLKLLQKARDYRQKQNKLWDVIVNSGSLGEEAVDSLVEHITGKEAPPRKKREDQGTAVPVSHTLDHGVDSEGNVKASGAPLLGDIALGKANIPGALGEQIVRVRKDED